MLSLTLAWLENGCILVALFSKYVFFTRDPLGEGRMLKCRLCSFLVIYLLHWFTALVVLVGQGVGGGGKPAPAKPWHLPIENASVPAWVVSAGPWVAVFL